jgi:acyl transferase domain-containing protein
MNTIIFFVYFLPVQRYGASASLDGELALFALQYALAKTWQKWGLEPYVCVGVGTGEYSAACVAGVLSLHDAISILQARQAVASKEESLASSMFIPFLLC